MPRLRLTLLCLLLSLCLFPCTQLLKAQPAERSAIPALHIGNDAEPASLHISKLSVDVVVIGNIATTTFDITFYNDRTRVFEGEFEFPLADGQNISRYALDMNGTLREGVVVEKAKARAAFENTVRRRIDPGLAEKTKGNNFRTRVYPIPAKGYKRVVIGVEETLSYVNNDMFYNLPLYSAEAIDSFNIETTVLTNTAKPSLQDNKLNNFAFNQTNNTWLAEYAQQNFTADNTIAFTIPFGGNVNDLLYTETVNGTTWFYLHSPLQGEYETKRKPVSIVLLWDISASSDKRNSKKEIAVIERYLSALQNVTVTVVPFNISVQKGELFTIVNGDASGLIRRLQQFVFDGGTQLGAIDLQQYKADEILLFSDGLSTFGKSELLLGNAPVTAVNSSPNADFSYLKFIALKTHGKFIDLGKTEAAKAVEDMVKEPLKIISTSFNTNEVQEVYTETANAIHSGFSVAGMLKKPSATITVNFGFGNTITGSRKYVVEIREQPEFDNIKRIWAGMKITKLDLQYEKNKEAITQLGKKFSIVTQNTSLLVLDRVEDYVQYEIVPPADLQEKYYALLQEKQNEKDIVFKEGLKAMRELKEWWKNKYDTIVKKQSMLPVQTEGAPGAHPNISLRGARTTSASGLITTNDIEFRADSAMLSEVVVVGYSTRARKSLTGAVSRVAGLQIQDEEREVKSTILPNQWKPDAPYVKILEATPADKFYEKYLALKKDYQNQPSFFVDVARFFMEKNEKTLAIQALSNVTEMKLESAELLRIVANELLEAGETALAIETFKQVLKIREEEPQSYRDLALAYNEAGDYNKAVELLYKVVTGRWNDRFSNGVKSIVLNEMNAIISAHPEVNISAVDTAFIAAMPVDVRIVIGWSSDNSDVDLWVTEPEKEKCSYQHALTARGGKLSGDITQGYGPEEYMIKKAANGNYIIEANLYGDRRQDLGGAITVKAVMFTNFGRPAQKRKVINFRVTTNKEVVKIGELGFGG